MLPNSAEMASSEVEVTSGKLQVSRKTQSRRPDMAQLPLVTYRRHRQTTARSAGARYIGLPHRH